MKKVYKMLLAVLMVFACLSCSDGNTYFDFDKKTFDAERTKWLEAGIGDYTFTIDYLSGNTGPQKAIITVENGESKSVESVSGREFTQYASIADIYDSLQAHASHNGMHDDSYIVGVTMKIEYDETYHYPCKVNYSTEYKEQVDGGSYYSFTITDFEVNKE